MLYKRLHPICAYVLVGCCWERGWICVQDLWCEPGLQGLTVRRHTILPTTDFSKLLGEHVPFFLLPGAALQGHFFVFLFFLINTRCRLEGEFIIFFLLHLHEHLM